MRHRPFDPARDEAFARVLYAETVGAELAVLPEPLRAPLLAQQYAAWSRSLGAHPALEDVVAELEGRPVARVILSRPPDTLHLVEIGVLSEARGRGLGTELLRELIARAASEGRTLRLTARRDGRARRLYERLGLPRESEDELHVRFALPPPAGER